MTIPGSAAGLIARLLAALRARLSPQQRETAQAKPVNPSLRALTASALALPGLAIHAAEGDSAFFQYGHYQEGKRQLFGETSKIKPIQVDNIHVGGNVAFFDRLKFAFTYIQDTWAGATPIASAPLALHGNRNLDPGNPVTGASPLVLGDGTLLYDKHDNPYRLDLASFNYVKDRRLAHTIASASPETRRQGNFKLGYEWDGAALDLSGGLSVEPDYESRSVGLGGRWDLNRKLTTLNLGLNYTSSDIAAQLDSEASAYYDYSAYDQRIDALKLPTGQFVRTLRGGRQDWSPRFSLTQVLNKNALVETGLGYTRTTGYQANAYKTVDFVFLDLNKAPVDLAGFSGLPPLYRPDVLPALERRPDARNQWTWDARYVQYIEGLDASLHLGYRFFSDDWGIDAHTFDADWAQPLGNGWTLTPRIRYYTQSAAHFYKPYFLYNQAVPKNAEGQFVAPVSNYSSDHRLSAFGALSGGATLSKALNKAVTFEADFEYYTHEGGLRLGGGGENAFADFSYYQFNAGVRLDLSAPFMGGGNEHEHHHGHGGHAGHAGGHAPAGVMFGHMMDRAGDAMAGYRFMYSRMSGDTLHGTEPAGDAEIVARGCGAKGCSYTSRSMSMYMHMLDLMYAPADWLNLMLMPQFMDMDMSFRPLQGGAVDTSGHHHGGAAPRHATGGVGDTGLYALFKLFDAGDHHVHATLGLSAPTGDVNRKVTNAGFIHYHMQLGSGTWDFRPSLTYTGHRERWSWGAQLSGTKRLQDHNASGFAFGDVFQSTAWGSYNLQDWLSASVRGAYMLQGAIRGQYTGLHSESSPVDLPFNYGGRYWDIGFGLNATVPSGTFQGNNFAVEWLQPVQDDDNGYQLDRVGTLNATWSLAF
jgi:hypothetical protein